MKKTEGHIRALADAVIGVSGFSVLVFGGIKKPVPLIAVKLMSLA